MSYIVGRIEDGGLVQDWTREVFDDRRKAAAEAVDARQYREAGSPLWDTRVYALVECEFIENGRES